MVAVNDINPDRAERTAVVIREAGGQAIGIAADVAVIVAYGLILPLPILEAPLTGVPNDLRFYSGGGGTVRSKSEGPAGIWLGLCEPPGGG